MVCTDRYRHRQQREQQVHRHHRRRQRGTRRQDEAGGRTARPSVTLPTISAGSSIPICTSITPGGDKWIDPSGKMGLAVPQARYVVQKRELDFAPPHQRTDRRAATRLTIFRTCHSADRSGEVEILPGIRRASHAGQCRITSRSGRERRRKGLLRVADLVPTSAHLRCRGSWATTSSRS